MLTDREISLLFSALHRILEATDPGRSKLLATLRAVSDSRYESSQQLAGVASDEASALERSVEKRNPHRPIPDGAVVYVSRQPGGNFTARVESSEMIDGALHYALVNDAGVKLMRTHYSNVQLIAETHTGSTPDGFAPFLRF